MVGLRQPLGVALHAHSRLEALHRLLGLSLHEQGIAEVVVGHGVGVVLLQRLLVIDLRLGEEAVAVEAVAVAHEVAVVLLLGHCGHSHEQQGYRHGRARRGLEEREAAEHMVLAFQEEHFKEEQHEGCPREVAKMLVELAVEHALHLGLAQLIDIFLQRRLRRGAVIDIDVSALSGTGYLAAHVLVELRDDGVAGIVGDVAVAAGDGDGSALGRAYAKDIDVHPFLGGSLCRGHCPTLVVLTVGDDEDGTTHSLLLREAVRGQLNGAGDVGALHGNHGGRDVVEEHLGRDIVASDGQLRVSIAGIDNEADFVINHIIYEAADEHLGLRQTAGRDILGHHGVTDVQGDDGLDAAARARVDASAVLRTCQAQHQHGQRRIQEPELQLATPAGDIGHQRLQQRRVAISAQALAAQQLCAVVEQGQQRDDCQQIEI